MRLSATLQYNLLICLYLDIGESIIFMLHSHFGILHSQNLSQHFYSTEVSDCFRKLLSGSPLINKQLTAVPDLVQWPLYEDDRHNHYLMSMFNSDYSSSYPPSTTAFFQG